MKKRNKKAMHPAVLFLLLFCPAALAQQISETPEGRAQQWDNWMKQELTLTTEQEPKVHEINLAYARQNEKLKTSGASRMSKLGVLRMTDKNKDTELKGVLTDKQFDLYLKKKRGFQKQLMKGLSG